MTTGHNNPPSETQFCEELKKEISKWLEDNPVIDSLEKAKAAKLLLDRANLALKDLESERKKQVDPLNKQVKEINDRYREPKETLALALQAVKGCINVYLETVEAQKIADARAAAEKAEAAKRAAIEAEKAAEKAAEESAQGVIIDAINPVIEANRAFSNYEKAEREKARLEKSIEQTKIVNKTLGTRATSLREREELILIDPIACIQDMGVSDELAEAILKAAREFRRNNNRVPQGIKIEKTRSV